MPNRTALHRLSATRWIKLRTPREHTYSRSKARHPRVPPETCRNCRANQGGPGSIGKPGALAGGVACRLTGHSSRLVNPRQSGRSLVRDHAGPLYVFAAEGTYQAGVLDGRPHRSPRP